MIDFHPFSNIWRLLTDKEFAEHKANIAARGQLLPIILYEGKILDGRNRYRACMELGIKPRYEQSRAKNDDEALDDVVSLNEKRRHLTLEERAFTAARLATLKQGTRTDILAVARKSQAEAATALNISVGSLARARSIINHGTPEDEEAVKSGKTSLDAADKKVRAKKKQAGPKQPSVRDRVLASRDERARNMHRLTPEEVDPDFKGTAIEFATEYGHVNLRTKVQKEHDQRLKKLTAITGAVAHMSTAAEDILKLGDLLDDAEIDVWFEIAANRRAMFWKRVGQIERALQWLRQNRLTKGPTHVVGGTDKEQS